MKKDYTYPLREGIKSIFTHGFMSICTISIIMACLVIMGSFSLIAVNIDKVISDAENKNEVAAFINEVYSEQEAKSISSKLSAIENIRTCEFVTKEQALINYRERLEDYAYLLDGLESNNPLRHRFVISFEDIELMEETVTEIEKIDGIEYVSANFELGQVFLTLRNILNAISFTLIIILFVVSLFIMANTIKLATFDRREEIAIMKMVGATNAFIRKPFIYEGIVLGIVGAVFAFFIQWGFYEYFQNNVIGALADFKLIEYMSLAPQLALMFLITGLAVGAGGSVISIRKFMNV